MTELFSHLRVVALLATVTTSMFAQRGPIPLQRTPVAERPRMLVVNDRSAADAVIRSGGRLYVELDALARITNASVTFQSDRVVFRFPETGVEQTPQGTEELSKPFIRAAIAELANARAWREAIVVVIQLGVPAGSWPQDYRGQTKESLMLAGAAASSPGDLRALELLQNGFADLQQWDNTTATTRATMIANQSIDPNAIENDSLLSKISDCQDFLSTMLVNGVFADHSSCR